MTLIPYTSEGAVFGQARNEETMGVEVCVLLHVFHYVLRGDYRKYGARFFLEVHRERIMGNRCKLHQEKFPLEVRKKFSGAPKRGPKEAGESPPWRCSRLE